MKDRWSSHLITFVFSKGKNQGQHLSGAERQGKGRIRLWGGEGRAAVVPLLEMFGVVKQPPTEGLPCATHPLSHSHCKRQTLNSQNKLMVVVGEGDGQNG